MPFESCTSTVQLYCVPLLRLPTVGVLPPPVGSVPQGIDVVELEKPLELELLPGICQIEQLLVQPLSCIREKE